ncbi:penicillin-binding protein 2 [Pseudanabaena sp. FACHB-1277]|jgi:penicillin-binding protein 2|uniref:Penicillin-binding protein 2 n=1 Tax=Pseudanabaena cinerea FACHB-1277 TaxID=2949581 RepID=A0A926UQH7_9CYAN|nr:penicillin-binding protein 2 [Pseudanabaena cinerea]MBD2148966.1 penicillin-binding protein 2 [Pseudanabaena cinerea FACHB-1277]
MTFTQRQTSPFNPTENTRTMGKGMRAAILFLLSVVVLLGLLGGRLFYLQLIEGDRNQQLAENNRIRLIAKPPERGRLFDRKGNILASSRLAHVVYLWPIAQPKEKWQPIIQRLSEVIGIPAQTILAKLEQEGYNSPNLVRVSSAISPKIVTALLEHSRELSGVQVEPEAVRYYPNGDIAAHVLGYTGEITAEELPELREKGYRPGDVLGKAGLEYAFEKMLRGEWGGQQVEVDAFGKVLRILGQKPPLAGNAVKLTIDLDLQKAVENILGDRQGGVVAMNPNNGEILAMVSHPAFDPNLFSGKISEAAWQRLQEKDHPFVNRVLQVYPPASTFKVVTMAAALESKSYSPNDVLPTYPYLDLGGFQFWDHNKAGFGTIGFYEAMAYSSNTFFGQVGMRIGEKNIAEWSHKFGYGEYSGIELKAEETKGTVPDPAWKQKVIGEPWYIGNTVNMSIGQGDVQANLLQVGMMTASVANGGFKIRPHLMLEDNDAKEWRQSLNISPTNLAALQKSLRAVFEFGTASSLSVADVTMAGKSGTAEDPPRPNHAWFTLYAPYEKPEIVVTAFAENAGGGGGSAIAAPLAVQTVEAYMKVKKQPNAPNNPSISTPVPN